MPTNIEKIKRSTEESKKKEEKKWEKKRKKIEEKTKKIFNILKSNPGKGFTVGEIESDVMGFFDGFDDAFGSSGTDAWIHNVLWGLPGIRVEHKDRIFWGGFEEYYYYDEEEYKKDMESGHFSNWTIFLEELSRYRKRTLKK
jgi:hypothetical protein